MTEIDILRAQIIRQDLSQPWGFRLQGGADVSEPLRLARVTPGSPAARIGLREGDEVTEIDNTPTDNLTYYESTSLIDQHTDSLLLTIERKARGSVPVNPVLFSSVDQSGPKPYQHFDLSGNNPNTRTPPRNYDYQYVQSKPFDTPAKRPQQLSYQPQPTYPLPTDNTDFYSTQIPADDPDAFLLQSQPQQLSPKDPQSRTFRMLQSVMENDEPYAGVAGLPPPRSATMEQMKREGAFQRHPQFPAPLPGSSGAPPGSRVKVIMPQKYNSPLAMYSADNVLETFTAQAESMLNNIEQRQRYGPEHEPLFSTNFH
jgi:hypothetical protein